MCFHTYNTTAEVASPDHEGCEERVRFLAEQCAELVRDNEELRANRDTLLRQLRSRVATPLEVAL